MAVEDDIAARQCGVLTRSQLLEAGLTPAQVCRRIAKGQLYRMHQGVYAVTEPRLLRLGTEAAALLAVGPRAVLSHRSAAAIWALARRDPGVVDVTMIGGGARARRGIRVRRVTQLDPRDLTTCHGLRVTTPARAIIDFATDATRSELEHGLSEGRALNLITDAKLDAALARAPSSHPGAAKVRALLRAQTGRVITRSERERKMLALLKEAGLPEPRVNVRLLGYEADFFWPEYKLILEFDGYGTHGTRAKFESDRKRDQTYAAAGIQTLRATWLQLEHEPVALVVRIGQALAARAA